MADIVRPAPSLVDPWSTGRRRLGWEVDRSQFVPWVAAGFAAVWIIGLLLRRADGLGTPAYDLGFFQQVVWNLGGPAPWTSSFHPGSFLGLHFSPILVVPAVLERVLGIDARWLSIVHAVALAALAPAAFLALRALLRPAQHATLVAAALAAPVPIWAATQEVARADFHPEAIGVVFALLAVWAGLTGRLAACWILAAAALACREDLGYAVMLAGLAIAARGRGTARRHGRLLAFATIAWTAIVFGMLMPAYRDGAVVDTARYYAWLSDGPPAEVAAEAIARLTRADGWFVVGGMIVSVAALPLARPAWLVLLLPPFVASLLSAHPPQALLLFHYPLILLTPVLIAAAFGGRRVIALFHRMTRHRLSRRDVVGRSRLARSMALIALIAPALVVAIAQGAIPPFETAAPGTFDRPGGIVALRAAVAGIPIDAVLMADDGLVAPLAARPEIRLLRAPVPADAYVVVEDDPWAPNAFARQRRDEIVARLEGSGRPLLVDDGRFRIWGPRPRAAP